MGSLEKRGSYESSSSEEERTQATKKTTSPERTGSFEKRISLIQTMPAIEQRLADKREDESAQPLKGTTRNTTNLPKKARVRPGSKRIVKVMCVRSTHTTQPVYDSQVDRLRIKKRKVVRRKI